MSWPIQSNRVVNQSKINKTGAASVLGSVVVSDDAPVITGDTGSALSSLVLYGTNMGNTLNGVLYGAITGHDVATTLTLYSDAARTVSVATGALAGVAGGTITLAEVSRSSLGGTVAVTANPEDCATIVVTLGTANAVKLAPAYAEGVRGVVNGSGDASGAAMRVAVSGFARVLLKDATAATRGGWIYTSGTAGRAVCALARDPSIIERQIGYAEEDVAAGVGQTVLAQIVLR